jgi:predicted 3-demethylubiquinone-9 3-methyltransferase (glyoxalase superfamily)
MNMAMIQKITPCLWFNDQGEEAAKFMSPFLKIPKWDKSTGIPVKVLKLIKCPQAAL